MNDWFTGRWPDSPARGELYNDDPRLGDARLCGTTASLCGMETEGNENRALQCDVMLHALLLTLSGLPVLYSGDEIGQLNDYSYHSDPEKREDSRYIHRGKFRWDLAQLRNDETTLQGRLFHTLRTLEMLRADHPAFRSDAAAEAFDTGSDQVLGIRRQFGEERVTALFNFSEEARTVANFEKDALDLLTGKRIRRKELKLDGYGFYWLLEKTGGGHGQ